MSSEVIIDIYSEFITEEEVQEAMEKFWAYFSVAYHQHLAF